MLPSGGPGGPATREALVGLAASVCLVGIATPGWSQEEEERAIRECSRRGAGGAPGVVGDSAGRLRGLVRDAQDGGAVEGATVRFVGRDHAALTDDDGEFVVLRVPPGSHLVQVEHPSFTRQRDCVTVPSGRSVRVEIALTPAPVPLDSLSVTVEEVRPRWLERQGFYRRRDMRGGIFFTRDEIVEENPSRLSYLFRGEAGVKLEDGRIRPRHGPTTMVTGPECPIQFFVDGRRMHLPLGIDTYQPGDVEAIEAYFGASRVPPQFNAGRAGCGAVVIWLRVRR